MLPAPPKDLSLLRPCATFLTVKSHFAGAVKGAEGLFLDMAVSGRAVVLGRGKVGSVRRERELYPSSETVRGGLD